MLEELDNKFILLTFRLAKNVSQTMFIMRLFMIGLFYGFPK